MGGVGSDSAPLVLFILGDDDCCQLLLLLLFCDGNEAAEERDPHDCCLLEFRLIMLEKAPPSLLLFGVFALAESEDELLPAVSF